MPHGLREKGGCLLCLQDYACRPPKENKSRQTQLCLRILPGGIGPHADRNRNVQPQAGHQREDIVVADEGENEIRLLLFPDAAKLAISGKETAQMSPGQLLAGGIGIDSADSRRCCPDRTLPSPGNRLCPAPIAFSRLRIPQSVPEDILRRAEIGGHQGNAPSVFIQVLRKVRHDALRTAPLQGTDVETDMQLSLFFVPQIPSPILSAHFDASITCSR